MSSSTIQLEFYILTCERKTESTGDLFNIDKHNDVHFFPLLTGLHFVQSRPEYWYLEAVSWLVWPLTYTKKKFKKMLGASLFAYTLQYQLHKMIKESGYRLLTPQKKCPSY